MAAHRKTIAGLTGLTPAEFRPRRTPRQRRSQIMYEKILDTAKMLFETEGYAFVSTNRIAEHANISIGSVYKYFPNCEAVALAIYEEASARASQKIKRLAAAILDLPLEKATARIISDLIDIYEVDKFALLELLEEVPQLREPAEAVSFDRLIVTSSQNFLQHHYPRVNPREIARKFYVIEHSLMGTLRAFLESPPPYLSKARLVKELTALVLFYLDGLDNKA